MSTPRKRRSVPNYPILDGHSRDKKRLVPPILGFPETSFVSTIDTIFPEILWIGLLLDWHGLRAGTEVVSTTLKRLWSANEEVNWYRFSEIAAHQRDLTRVLNDEEVANIANPFADLRLTYNWPGLDWASVHDDAFEAGRRIDSAVRKYVNRFEQPYLTMVATVIYSMAISDRMKFAPGTVPDIEAIVSDWGSDRAEMAACSIRACSMAFFSARWLGSERSVVQALLA